MNNDKFQAVLDFINTCPLVGYDMYFNFIDETNSDGNTSLLTVGHGDLVKTYTDGESLKKFQCEIRQVKPLSAYSNTNENAEQMSRVQDFLNWINEQGKNKNFPDFGQKCKIQRLKTPDGVDYPMFSGVFEGTALYSFPFEILYLERK